MVEKTENNFDYYLIGSDSTKSVPLLMPYKDQSTSFILGREPIDFNNKLDDFNGLMELCFRPPVPANPKMVDFHELPSSVFSKKIYDVLQPMNIDGLQLLPARVMGKNNEIYNDYFVAYIYKRIKCLDMDHSVYDVSKVDGKISWVHRFFIDKNVLKKIPLKERLVFLLEEDMPKRIYHKSVVDVIMDTKPVGIKFYQIPEWYEGIQFDNEEE